MPDQRRNWNGAHGFFWRLEHRRYERMLRELGARVLDCAGLSPGQRVLDVGCGCGGFTVQAGRRVATGGKVVGLDISEKMVAKAESLRPEVSGARINFLCADAQERSFTPNSFDAIVSLLGMTFFDRPERALMELRRVLRPAGCLSFACWRPLDANEWLHWFRGIEGLHSPAARPRGPGPFAWSDHGVFQPLLEEAGFQILKIKSVEQPLKVGESAEAALSFFLRGGLQRHLEQMHPAEARLVKMKLLAKLAESSRPDGIWLGSSAWVVVAGCQNSRVN